MTHELHLGTIEDEILRSKGMELKAIKNEESKADKHEALVVRKFHMFYRNQRSSKNKKG